MSLATGLNIGFLQQLTFSPSTTALFVHMHGIQRPGCSSHKVSYPKAHGEIPWLTGKQVTSSYWHTPALLHKTWNKNCSLETRRKTRGQEFDQLLQNLKAAAFFAKHLSMKWTTGFYYWDLFKVEEPFLLKTEMCGFSSKWSWVDLALHLCSATCRTHHHNKLQSHSIAHEVSPG